VLDGMGEDSAGQSSKENGQVDENGCVKQDIEDSL